MRKYSLLVVVLLAALLIGCGGRTGPAGDPTNTPLVVPEETASSSAQTDPTAVPPTAGASDAATDAPDASPAPSDQAECVPADAEFPVEPYLPPVSVEDHSKGPSDAPITLIGYSDFQ